MIWYFILKGIVLFLGTMFSWLPLVTQLPLGMDDALSTAFGYLHYVIGFIPPLDTMYQAFLWFVGFELTLLVLRLFRVIR